MFIRALLAFLALPGIFAFGVPIAWLLVAGRLEIAQPLGLVPLALGISGLLWTVREFYAAGKGTLAPWSPPRQLVTTGLYRFSRNPMYVAVILILLGWAATFWYWPLLGYATVLAVAFHLRVVRYEEPVLERSFDEDWRAYREDTRRWW